MSLVRKACGCFVDEGAAGSRVLTPCRSHAAVVPPKQEGDDVLVPRHVLRSVLKAADAFGVKGPGFDAIRALLLPPLPEQVSPSGESGMAVWEGEPDDPQG